ncbi:MAG: Hsp20 family protein [Pseudomonadota bacterium]|nr:Hsp20 family protein [Pseudomonadota bacterium]
MARMSVFNSPLLLGFDHFERILDQASKVSAEGYPPYNIEQTGENGLRITLAVAGFSMSELNVSLEDNQLVIRGQLSADNENGLDNEQTVFLHRGIASRQFQRSFVLAEGIEVKNASLDNGLLLIELERLQPEPEIRNIKIESGKSSVNKMEHKTIDVQPD